MSRYYLNVGCLKVEQIVDRDMHGCKHDYVQLTVGEMQHGVFSNVWTFPLSMYNRIVKHVYRAQQAVNTAFATKRFKDVGTIYQKKLNDVVTVSARRAGNYYLAVVVTIDNPFEAEHVHLVFDNDCVKRFIQAAKNV